MNHENPGRLAQGHTFILSTMKGAGRSESKSIVKAPSQLRLGAMEKSVVFKMNIIVQSEQLSINRRKTICKLFL